MRYIKRVLALIAILIAVPVAALWIIPEDRILSALESRVEAATGRAVRFEGGVSPSLYPQLGLTTGPVEIENASWSDAGPILRAEKLHVALDPIALLRGKIAIEDVSADTPQVILETAEDGAVNWDFFTNQSEARQDSTPQAQKETDAEPLNISLRNLSLTDAAIRFVDRQNGQTVEILDLDVSVQAPDAQGPTDFSITFTRGQGPIVLSGQLGRTETFLLGNESPVTAQMTAAGSTLSFSGSATLSGVASGEISADIRETKSLLTAIGLPGVDIPAGFGRKGTLSATLNYGPEARAELGNISAKLDETILTGALAADFAGTPTITGAIASPNIDLTSLASSSDTPSESSSRNTASGWPTTPIDASALSALNADILFSAERFAVPGVALSGLESQLTIDNARAVLNLTQAQGFGGQFSGKVIANNRSGFSSSASFTARAVQLETLLDQTIGYDRLVGSADAEFSVLGSGASIDRLMRSLRGEGRLSVPSGELIGVAIADLILNQGEGGGRTVFSELGASFQIQDGVLSNSDLKANLPAAQLAGQGKVDIGDQALDYTLTPRLSEARQGNDLVFPVIITGSWSSPKIRPDLEAAIAESFQSEIEEQKKALESRAKNAVAKEVQKQLGVEATEGQSIEDAVTDKLKNDVIKGLGDLFK
ncbi:MAG: AsmA family protein [Pseudomonadota bacterium]